MPQRMQHRMKAPETAEPVEDDFPEMSLSDPSEEPFPVPPVEDEPHSPSVREQLRMHMTSMQTLSLQMPNSELLGELMDAISRVLKVILEMERVEDASAER